MSKLSAQPAPQSTDQWDQTCWRGVQIPHPAEWELSRASGPGDQGRCTFVDRCFQRLDVRWRRLNHEPPLAKILEKFRQKKEANTEFEAIPSPATGWEALGRKTPEGYLLSAGRFFKLTRQLVEVTVVWPGRKRQKDIERRILAGMDVQDPKAPLRHWQAMGIRMDVSRELDLVEADMSVGRIRWDFRPVSGKGRDLLTVERLAVPEYWLDDGLEKWLAKQPGTDCRPGEAEAVEINGHPGRRFRSTAHGHLLRALIGQRYRRVDVAWECPGERRVYHLAWSRRTRDDRVEMPDHVHVECS